MDALIKEVYFYSDNPEVVTVDKHGLIKANNLGWTFVNAASIDGGNARRSWIVYVGNNDSSIGTVNNDECTLCVSIHDNYLSISGKSTSDEILLYDMLGNLLLRSFDNLIRINQKGKFILSIGCKTFKVII